MALETGAITLAARAIGAVARWQEREGEKKPATGRALRSYTINLPPTPMEPPPNLSEKAWLRAKWYEALPHYRGIIWAYLGGTSLLIIAAAIAVHLLR